MTQERAKKLMPKSRFQKLWKLLYDFNPWEDDYEKCRIRRDGLRKITLLRMMALGEFNFLDKE